MRAIPVTVAVVLILAATSVTVYIKNKNKPQSLIMSFTLAGSLITITEALVAAPTYNVDKYIIHMEVGLYECTQSVHCTCSSQVTKLLPKVMKVFTKCVYS
ncbi:hypothetical protein ACJIZ3_014169 [Penstemon smallii]|uniref:Transmembrane protein n=1 Tax=Penstemon smallii TaxID=265156 RepID=A0ABD3RM31_9LAMI